MKTIDAMDRGARAIWLLLVVSGAACGVEQERALAGEEAGLTTRRSTLCSFRFEDAATGWRTHAWTAADCSNGLPQPDWLIDVAQGQNGVGTAGQARCTPGAGAHYSHPKHGATTGSIACLYSPPLPQAQPGHGITTCTHRFGDRTTGWRTRTWTAADCTNGLPSATARAVGYGQNGGGTGGMVHCLPTHGSHYNHPTEDGATEAQLTCTYVAPVVVTDPEFTECEYFFSDDAAGWRSHRWSAADCTHGLPRTNATAVGQAGNGWGTDAQASCTPTAGEHHNVVPTVGVIRCLFHNAAAALP